MTFRKTLDHVASHNEMFAQFPFNGAGSFETHARRASTCQGEWFEITQHAFHYMLGIMPPLYMRNGYFVMSERLTGDISSAFFEIGNRYFHAFCNTHKHNPELTRAAIQEATS